MIRSSKALLNVLRAGRRAARLLEMSSPHIRWVMTDTNEPIHASAINRLAWGGALEVVSRDLCGDPLQVGAK